MPQQTTDGKYLKSLLLLFDNFIVVSFSLTALNCASCFSTKLQMGKNFVLFHMTLI